MKLASWLLLQSTSIHLLSLRSHCVNFCRFERKFREDGVLYSKVTFIGTLGQEGGRGPEGRYLIHKSLHISRSISVSSCKRESSNFSVLSL